MLRMSFTIEYPDGEQADISFDLSKDAGGSTNTPEQIEEAAVVGCVHAGRALVDHYRRKRGAVPLDASPIAFPPATKVEV